MTGRRYYITTLADWHRHAHRFANSHWLALAAASTNDNTDSDADGSVVPTVGARHAVPERAAGTGAPSSRKLADASCTVNSASSCADHGRATNGTAEPSSIAGHGSAVPLLNTIEASANADASSARDAKLPGINATARIVVLVDADEGVHLALDDDGAFEPLPHPFAPKAISHAAHEALASHGVTPGATTFDAAEAVARAHPLLRPRVF